MLNVLYTILVFNLLIIIFKLFARYKVDNLQALIVNYFTAAVMGILFSESSISIEGILKAPWLYHGIAIGALFIVVFNFYAFGTQKVGISVTTVANKMSLIIPVGAALVLYPDDKITISKIIGFILAIIGIYLSSTKKGKLNFNKKYLWLILAVFIGQGIADAIFNDASQLVRGDSMPFFIALFVIAGISGILILTGKSLASAPKLEFKNIIWGIALGIPNFFSLWFMLKALSSPDLNGSEVFPLVSMGVVVLSSVIGLVLYKEKLEKSNWLGVLLAVGSIASFTFGPYIFK